MIGVITGTGSYVPKKIVDNNDLSQIMDTNDEWIRERTGIVRRHVVQEESTVSMATEAAKRALEDAKVNAEDLDMIIVSTISSDVVLPATACEVQKNIGATKAVCFDLSAACTGFLFALNTAQAYFHAGVVKKVLLVGAESLSSIVDWSDRGSAILFGDGAGAAVLEAGEGEFPTMVMHSDGFKGEALRAKTPIAGRRYNDENLEQDEKDTFIAMNGQEVFKFAVRKVPECLEELLEKSGKSLEDVDYFILHQANQRIVESIAKRLKTDIEKFPMNLMEYGNTSSASIPILLDELNKNGTLKKGMQLAVAGFGAGLSWGATWIEWQR
ncbi:MAG: ketoacyl-ACP synthase III [Lachnospiraceae bacterium]|nr:ketoacyl-ACP synthase III [Lachnospiraceae bacterium]